MAAGSFLQIVPYSVKPSAPPVGSFLFYMKTDNILYLEDSSGTEFPFGSTAAITALTGDVSAVGPGSAVATVNFVGGQTATNIASATIAYSTATSANTPSTLVMRDSFGNFSANTITASLMGNATTATAAVTATTAANFSGSLSGDVIGTQGSTVVSYVDSYTAAAVGASVAETQAATSINTASTLVLRDASGNFAANIITAALMGNATSATMANTATNFTGSLSGDVTGTQSATTIASTIVTGKLLTGLIPGTNTVILSTDSILIALEKLQAQVSGTTGTAITALTGDVSATGPGSVTSTIESIQGTTVSGTTGTGNVVFSTGPTVTGLLSGSSASFSSTILASNFSGSSSGTNTGDVTVTNTNSINLAFTSSQSGLNAILNLSAAAADAGNLKATYSIKTDGLFMEYPFGTPINIGTINNAGAASSFALSDHVHALTASITTGQLLTGYVTGTNTPITATNSILTAFENLQAQVSATSGAAITALSGDGTATGPGSVVFTLSTVNSNVGTFGSSTSIPSFAVNAKGLITAASGNAVVAPAGTLSGTTLNATVVSSSLTSVGTITSGVWNGTPLAAAYMLALPTNDIYIGNGSNQPAAVTVSGDITIVSSGATTIQTNVVSNSKLAQMVANTLKGNNTGSPANASDLTVSQVNTMLGTITTIGTYNGQTPSANGAVIAGNSIFFQSASTSNPGMVDINTQSFAGNKTFTGTVSITPSSTSALVINTTSFVFDSVNNAAGIGIQPATNTFVDAINSTAASKTLQLTGYGIGSTVGTRGRFARGTSGSPTAAQSGDVINFWSARGYGASQFAAASTAAINAIAGETFTNTSNLTYLAFNTTPTGSVTSAESMRITSTGITLGPQSSSTAIHMLNGGVRVNRRTITASFAIDTTTTDYLVLCNNSSAITITLPTPTDGRVLVFMDIAGTANTNNVTIARNASEKISGLAANFIFQTNWGCLIFYSDGTDWYIG